MRSSVGSLVVTAFIFLTSCGNPPPCNNSNALLASKSDQTTQYKHALADKLRTASKEELTYHYEGYQKQGNKETIFVNVYGDSLCARMELVVNDWSKLAGVRREPSGYSGAVITGLQYDIMETGGTASADKKDVVFVYRTHDTIID
jgi:hypothetical protein